MGSEAINAADKTELRKSIPPHPPSIPQFFQVRKDGPEYPSSSDIESTGLSVIWSTVSGRRVCLSSSSLDFEALQESVAVGRKALSQLVALEWTVCELLISVGFSSWVIVKDRNRES